MVSNEVSDTDSASEQTPDSQTRTTFGGVIWRLPSTLLIGLVRIYQWTLSPLIGRQCRFHPTCSNYFIEAVKKDGAISGSIRGIKRICRCHPFHPGGYDPP